MSDPFAAAQRIADAVLYEGYLLYPYHAASGKNRVRFQFGVVAPQEHCLIDPSESWAQQTELLVDPAGGAEGEPRLTVRVRFLQLQARAVEEADPTGPDGFRAVPVLTVGEDELVAWDEAIEGAVDIPDVSLAELVAVGDGGRPVPFAIAAGRDVEEVRGATGTVSGRIVRTRWQISGRIVLVAAPVESFVRLTVRVENLTASPDAPSDAPSGVPAPTRDDALRRSLLGCHTLLSIRAGAFFSQTDPPPAAAAAAGSCLNLKTWPVLVGDEGASDLVLSSPIILSDHPAVAPESPRDLFDGAEIDEILTLRIMTLSDEEKRQARATDPRARAIIDAADDMPPEILDRLHGAIRYLRDGPAGRAVPPVVDELAPAQRVALPDPDWPTIMTPSGDEMPASVWEPAARIAPELMTVDVGGRSITKGASVRLRPNRRADAMDTFLVGRLATVEAIFESVDDELFVAVTIDDDPGSDLHRSYGRFFYFAPDELEPLGATASAETGR